MDNKYTYNTDVCNVVDNGKVKYLQFKKLLEFPEINHAYILKTYDMNFRLGKDFHNLEMVRKNLKRVSEELNFSYESIIRPDYMHTSNVQVVDFVDNSTEIPELSGKRFKDTDGLITNKANISLMSTNADCNLLIFYDPVKKVLANVHAGWKGTLYKIAKVAASKMKSEFNCNSKDILVFMAPSIRKCHFEVDVDVKEICENNFAYTNKLDLLISKGEVKDNKQKYFIDLALVNKILLNEEEIPSENIFDSKMCSVCNSEIVHSRRAEGEYFGLGLLICCRNDT